MPLGDSMKKIRKSILFLSFIIILIICTTLIVTKTIHIIANAGDERVVIYIDPGHGGFDGGATSLDNNTIEKDITLKVSLYLKAYLERTNIKVLLTRDKDISLASNKRNDILKRVSLINNSNCDLYISIHVNSYTSSLIWGAQTFYNKVSNENKYLATSILEQIKLIDKFNKRESKEISGKYLLDHVNKVGCLVEIGFLTNQNELAKLKEDTYLENMAFMIYLGILDYLEVKTYGTINIKN